MSLPRPANDEEAALAAAIDAKIRRRQTGEHRQTGQNEDVWCAACSERWPCRADLQAQVKRLTQELKQVKAVAYNYADFSPTCKEDGVCFICGEYLHGDKHADDCLATLFRRVIKDGDEASMVWLEVLDAKEQAERERNDANWQLAVALDNLHCEIRPTEEAAIKAEGRNMLGCEDDTAIESWCVPCQIRAKSG